MLSVHDDGGFAPCPAPFNLAEYVLTAGAAAPDRLALAEIGPTAARRTRFGALIAAVRGTATGLQRAGLVPGDRVLLRLGNSAAFPVAYLGAIAAGIVPVPTSAQLTEREVAPMIDLLRPAAILRDPAIACPATTVPEIGPDRMSAWHDLPPADWDRGDPDRPAYIVFTSGTSGTPRAVVHAHRAIWARRMMHRGWYDLRGDDRMLHAGAFNWTFTLGTGLLDPWTVGAAALIPRPGTDPAQLPLLLRRYEATLFAAAPGVFRKLLRGPVPPLPRLRHGLSAGEALPAPVRTAWEESTGTPVHEAFGMSECSTFVSGAPERPAEPGFIGAPQPGRRVAILGGDGTPVPRGTEGDIAVHGSDPGLMLGYLHAPDETAARFRGGWFVTGDRGLMSESGQIAYRGRADDLMNAGGYRVSPLEVEAALADLPGLDEIAVTDIAVRDGVRVVAAFYTSAQPLEDDALEAAAAERLARYKQPRAWIRVAALPRGPNGKLLRTELWRAPRA